MRGLALIAAATLVSAPFSASAQAEQTPEGAVRFLRVLAENGSLLVDAEYLGVFSPAVRLTPETGESRRQWGPARRIALFEETGPCTSRYTLETPPSTFKPGDREYYSMSLTPEPMPPVTLDLSQVTTVRASTGEEETLIFLEGAEPGFRFSVADDNLRPRVTYALEFLRQRCDRTADTGF